jgi:UDP-N-acetylglucosamine--N-acetylmuramyl-(pentapeptide) pyrophosphoryl-undecaprenol N-acetylglucosamine transferase
VAKATEALRVVIAGGGTGGHLYPGLAVAHELRRQRPDATVTFAGTAQGIEARVVPREGFELDVLRSAGLKGKSLGRRLRGVALLPLSGMDALAILRRRRPHVVLGVGGYSSGPVVLAAAARRTRTMVLEQNAVPGLANRLLARVVDAAAVTYDEAVAWFGSKAVVTGNPVRAGFVVAGETRPRAEAADARAARVLVFGGSQGAHAINLAMIDAAQDLAAMPVDVTHQTGPSDLAAVRRAYEAAGLRGRVEAFFDEMDREMARADLIVCRAGATTLAEVTAAGRPALLVPLPTATDDHQRKNAEALVRAGAAEMIEQRDLTGASLAASIRRLVDDPARRDRLAQQAHALSRPDAARAIVERIIALAEGARPGNGVQ